MAASGVELHIRKKLVNQHLIDLAQVGEKLRQIEHTTKVNSLHLT
jgi:hypothetical protein